MTTVRTLLASALLMTSPSLLAQSVQITGFGQMVAGTVSDGNSFPGTGYDSDWDFKDESLFALQVRGDLNEQWSATAQLVARGRDDFDPEFAWAYLGWNGGNGWSAKLGRQRMPLYRYSDFLEVGYAFPWIRVPNPVYNLDFRNYDGLGLTYSFGAGDWFSAVQLSAGRFDGTISLSGQDADAELGSLVGLSAESTYADWLTVRGSYFEADVSIDSPALAPLLAALSGNGFANVASRIDYTEDPGSFWSFGVEVNRGNWMLVGEVIGVEVEDAFLADRSEFYVSGGYRFGNLMPTIMWGRRDNAAKPDIVALLPNVPPLAPLRAGVSQIVFSEGLDATYWSYGLRWDVATNVALKADYTQYTNDTPASADADSLAVGVVFTF
jgi:hypothetical protein